MKFLGMTGCKIFVGILNAMLPHKNASVMVILILWRGLPSDQKRILEMTDINALLREQDAAIKWLCRYVSDFGNMCLHEDREGAPKIFDMDKRVKAFLAADMVAVPKAKSVPEPPK